MTAKPCLVPVGGFLGAGKTTLILAAARELAKRGLRSAAIMNDQGSDLVDTQHARANGLDAAEVTGGCFCCRLSDLISAARDLRARSPDVIFAEPVGSCTDISATTIRPILRDHFDEFDLAPYTVLVDSARAHDLLARDPDDDLAFLFRKQMDEADLICLTKSDLGGAGAFDCAIDSARRLSARTGEGVALWLDEVLSGGLRAGRSVLDIDYARYARAEAALAWLNVELSLMAAHPISPAMAIGPLTDQIAAELRAAGIDIVHLKISCDCDTGFLKAALCGTCNDPIIEGALDASPSLSHRIRVNLRASGDPDQVRALVRRSIARLPGKVSIARLDCFRPSPPRPERRITV